jgi:hypothetical protein
MQGKIFAIALIILGVYILSSVLFGSGSSDDRKKGAEIYHIGCYDIDRPLTYSREIESYLSNLSDQFNQTSSSKVAELSSRVKKSVFAENGGN